MPALDTNLLVRLLVQDDAAQLETVRNILNEAKTPLFVPVTVILELEWVLRSRYGFARPELQRALSALLETSVFAFESERALDVALQLFADGGANFADCLHLALAAQADALPLLTFDRDAARLVGAALAHHSALGNSGNPPISNP